jgi:hypothetical protein
MQAVLCVIRSTLACGYTALEVLMGIIRHHPDFQEPFHLRTNSTDISRKQKGTSQLQHYRQLTMFSIYLTTPCQLKKLYCVNQTISTYGEMQRMGTKLGNCDVKQHTRTSEIRPKGWRKSTKCTVDTASAERTLKRGFFFFTK